MRLLNKGSTTISPKKNPLMVFVFYVHGSWVNLFCLCFEILACLACDILDRVFPHVLWMNKVVFKRHSGLGFRGFLGLGTFVQPERAESNFPE